MKRKRVQAPRPASKAQLRSLHKKAKDIAHVAKLLDVQAEWMTYPNKPLQRPPTHGNNKGKKKSTPPKPKETPVLKEGEFLVCCDELECNRKYEKSDIFLIRSHFLNLSDVDKRTFAGARTEFDHKSTRRGQKFFLEAPEGLAPGAGACSCLAAQQGACSTTRNPDKSTLTRVCAEFFTWVTNKSISWLYQRPRLEAQEPTVKAGPSTNTFQAETGHCPVKDEIVKYLKKQKEEAGLPVPNKGYTILGFVSKQEAHACMIIAMEYERNVKWVDEYDVPIAKKKEEQRLNELVAEEMKMIAGAAGQREAGQDPQEEIWDDEAEEEGHVFEHLKKWRYSNPLLGKVSADRPELPEGPGYKYFCKVWNADPEELNVRLRRWLPFTRCDECHELREESLNTSDPEVKKKALKALAEHRRLVRQERSVVDDWREKTKKNPGRYLFLQIDAADQSEHDLPHFHCKTKQVAQTRRAKVHVMGVLSHGRAPHVFLMGQQCKTGHNFTIEAVWNTIVKTLEAEGQLPEILILSLDNTTHQNKGKFLVAFLSLLVKAKVFKKVFVVFLPVGHTHERVDQMFSRLAVYLRYHNALSLKELQHCVASCYTTAEGLKPVVEELHAVANISEWCNKKKALEMTGCQAEGWRYYRIKASPDNNDQVSVQVRSQLAPDGNDSWRGIKEDAYDWNCFKEMPDLPAALRNREVPPAQRPTPCHDGITPLAC